MNVGIIGGAFDPITVGHIEMADYVLRNCKLVDEVWLLPCGDSHAFGKQMASPEHRLEMCRLATSDPKIKVCDYEIINNFSDATTYKTVQRLLAADLSYDLAWIIGMDNANCFDKWSNHEALANIVRFIVVPRQGCEADPKVDWYLKKHHIFLNGTGRPIADVSSTQVRQWIKDYYDTNEMPAELFQALPTAVLDYIIAHDLYR